MREILFRGKRIDNGEWVYGNYIHAPNITFVYNICELDSPHDWYEVDPQTVGQFTGIHDKNGKKIFEGDVVRAMMNWGPAGMIESKVVIEFKKHDGYRWNYFDVKTIEVIDNIHDNPELLEGR